MTDKLYAYGTLRLGTGPTVLVNGTMFDLVWYPGVKLGGPNQFICEIIETEDWTRFDRYEGYNEANPAGSLYIRRPYLDGYIYEYNYDVGAAPMVESGDWLQYVEEIGGKNATRFG